MPSTCTGASPGSGLEQRIGAEGARGGRALRPRSRQARLCPARRTRPAPSAPLRERLELGGIERAIASGNPAASSSAVKRRAQSWALARASSPAGRDEAGEERVEPRARGSAPARDRLGRQRAQAIGGERGGREVRSAASRRARPAISASPPATKGERKSALTRARRRAARRRGRSRRARHPRGEGRQRGAEREVEERLGPAAGRSERAREDARHLSAPLLQARHHDSDARLRLRRARFEALARPARGVLQLLARGGELVRRTCAATGGAAQRSTRAPVRAQAARKSSCWGVRSSNP